MRLAPFVFVLLWSTGFIGAKYGLPYAGPFTFLSLRMIAAVAGLGLVALYWRTPWPQTSVRAIHIAIAGILVHGLYLGGVFFAISQGMPAGLTALIVGLQPLLTAFIAHFLMSERIIGRQWLGLVLGLLGVGLVVSQKISFLISLAGVFAAIAALFGITAGTLYQKRFCPDMNLVSGAFIQYAVTLIPFAILAVSVEPLHIEWTTSFIFALAWLTGALSVGAVFLLFILINSGQAVQVAGLFYLTPPTTAIMAFILFDEALSLTVFAGFIAAAVGVAMVRR
jgi:drug/metabolite transporter (DMT)-like permease